MKRVLAVLATIALASQVSPTLQASVQPSLNFFKNYFITGDYAVQGVGLRGAGVNGQASGDIVIPVCAEGDTERLGCVPKSVDVVAAFLYWQVIGDTADPMAGARGVQFKGQPLSLQDNGVEVLYGKGLGLGTPPCWANGGGTGQGSGQNNLTFTYRADALRFLDIDPDTGKTAGYGTHRIVLPDTQKTSALGASLVVIYRESNLPYSAIILYDGSYSMANATPSMTLSVRGFYDADDVNRAGKLTHIVGSGQANKGETVFYNDMTFANPFTGAAGNNWDNPTFPVTVDPSLQAITTGAAPAGNGSFDCLTWAAVVYRTPVNDDDHDGLLNRWETSTTPIVDPYNRALPRLAKMGADPNVPDLFIEINYLKTDVPQTYGNEVKPAHTHKPDPEAVRLFGDMFKAKGIKVHIDLGPDYDVGTELGAEEYLIRDTVPGEGLARGGEAIDESLTVCEPPAGSPPWVCQFSDYPGTVGWKTGLRRLRDSFINAPPVPPGQEDPCDAAGSTCARRFDDVRMDTFRYALFAHFVGLPKSTKPCRDAELKPVEDVNGECPAGTTLDPEFREPRTYSGVADFPGGDLIVSLGGFNNAAGLPVGTPFMQASTLAHEFGHTAERRHGGEALEPNCKPGYLSVMNYLYQLRGLLDDDGKPHLDFADGTPFANVDESAVQEGIFSTSTYRLGWYAPLDFSYLKDRRMPAKARCDGSPLQAGERMVRIDARSSQAPLDWNANDVIESETYAQDVNYNGLVNGTGPDAISGPLKGVSDDWSSIKLNQVGSRRNVGGLFRMADGTLAVGPLSLDVGKVDLGPSDLGKVDLELGKVDLDFGKVDLDLGKVDLSMGKVDLGKVDLGKVDLGKVDLDLGAAQTGSGDLGRGDFGGGDMFTADVENPGGELDATTAAELARTPPNEFQVCVADATCTAAGANLHDVVARFTAPNIGGVAAFKLYRVAGPTLKPGDIWTLVSVIPANPAKPQDEPYVAFDTTELLDGQQYTYFAIATYQADGFQTGIDSDPSNLVTITAINLPAAAGDDQYAVDEDTSLVQPAPGVLANDSDPDSAVTLTAQLVSGPAHGTLVLNANGSFSYTPSGNYAGPDSFRYRAVASGVTTNVATVSITVRPVNDGPLAFDIPDKTIAQGTSTGPIAFTLADDGDPAAIQLTGTSSNTVLVPDNAIVFGGSGASRTVTVTPVATQSGTAVITVRATDAGGLVAVDTFLLTVTSAAQYTFVNVKNAPPLATAKFKAGSAIPMQWQYMRWPTIVDSSGLTFTVVVSGPTPDTTLRNTDTGSSNFRYQASNKTWVFNLQTKENGKALSAGTYNVTITPNDPRYAPSPTFQIRLTK